MDIDVLIVGAGPTGLMLANQLVRRGIAAMIIDRHSGPAQQTRAMAVHARTLEIYSKLGIAERALELGQKSVGANIWTEGSLKARIPLGDIGKNLSPFPFVLMLGQDDNEQIMGDHLRNWNMAVQWSTELVALEQEDAYATATLKYPDGSARKIKTAYIAGCDGMHSAVREFSSITFPGAPYEHVFFVADTEATGSMVKEELNVYLWRDGFYLFFPMHGTNRWRVIGILPDKLRKKEDLEFEDIIPAIRQEANSELTFTSCNWFSTYHIYHRYAERFRERRCFLLGDAAHVHSPMGGQGMNTGLQDAYNLAWKLAFVVTGQASTSLLDTYENERMPVAKRLLETTDRAFTRIVSNSPIAGIFRSYIFSQMVGFAMSFEQIRRLAFLTISQIGIAYRNSPLSRVLTNQSKKAPHAGDRFPWLHLRMYQNGPIEDLYQQLDDTCFNLIVIGQPSTPIDVLGHSNFLHMYVIPNDEYNAEVIANSHIPKQAFYLLRPDGHIALVGNRLEPGDIVNYLFNNHIHILRENTGIEGYNHKIL